ncbi:MAG: hypothetical protein MRZ79_08595 [Bacteroidia bacterium]|nr:hypothetical protein [Bacteroidia bacterium]
MDIKSAWEKGAVKWQISALDSKECYSYLYKKYSEPHRAYHNLHHINDLLKLFERDELQLKQARLVEMAIWFHDVIYDPKSKKNELKSAQSFEKYAIKWGIENEETRLIFEYILATQTHHNLSYGSDLDWFLDADLAILGADQDRYQRYCQEIRKEYKIYPDFLYKPGRKKVLIHMLAKDRIYQTESFYKDLEAKARMNLAWELRRY